MPLECECEIPDEWVWGWEMPPENEAYTHYQRARGSRCFSCDSMIRKGDLSAEFKIVRAPTDFEIEHGIRDEEDEIKKASKWLCERCADIFYSLEALGYCVHPNENMPELLDEYHKIIEDLEGTTQ